MNVEQLINKLQKCDPNKIVIITEPNGIGWDNIGNIIDSEDDVKITIDGNGLFQES